MAKNKPTELEPLEPETVYFINQITEGWMCQNHWLIYSKTKWGDKWFQVYDTKEKALSAAKAHGLTINYD